MSIQLGQTTSPMLTIHQVAAEIGKSRSGVGTVVCRGMPQKSHARNNSAKLVTTSYLISAQNPRSERRMHWWP
jgi:hypothetical protein